MIDVYMPQHDTQESLLWNSIATFLQANLGPIIICGDFNFVKYASKRIGSSFFQWESYDFNELLI